MRKNIERERKDSEEGFKAEMHKMENQKRDLKKQLHHFLSGAKWGTRGASPAHIRVGWADLSWGSSCFNLEENLGSIAGLQLFKVRHLNSP